jgi:hypothetical protein
LKIKIQIKWENKSIQIFIVDDDVFYLPKPIRVISKKMTTIMALRTTVMEMIA